VFCSGGFCSVFRGVASDVPPPLLLIESPMGPAFLLIEWTRPSTDVPLPSLSQAPPDYLRSLGFFARLYSSVTDHGSYFLFARAAIPSRPCFSSTQERMSASLLPGSHTHVSPPVALTLLLFRFSRVFPSYTLLEVYVR